MTKHDSKQAAATYTHACARCRVPVISTNPPDGQNTFCPACFAQNLGQVETWVLEDYCQFGAWARHKSAQIFLERYRSTPTVRERKFLALKIYEEFLLAAEDLELLYVALRDRAKRTVLESMLTVNLNDKTAAHWLDELRGPDDQVLERLGLMANGAVIGFSEAMAGSAMSDLSRLRNMGIYLFRPARVCGGGGARDSRHLAAAQHQGNRLIAPELPRKHREGAAPL